MNNATLEDDGQRPEILFTLICLIRHSDDESEGFCSLINDENCGNFQHFGV